MSSNDKTISDFFKDYVRANAEPHQNQASIVPLPFLVLSKSFWIKNEKDHENGTGEHRLEPKGRDECSVEEIVKQILTFINEICPKHDDREFTSLPDDCPKKIKKIEAHSINNDMEVLLCPPLLSNFQTINNYCKTNNIIEKDKVWRDEIDALTKQLCKDLNFTAFEVKFSPWKKCLKQNASSTDPVFEKEKLHTERLRYLIRVETSREILSVNIYIADRKSTVLGPFDSFRSFYHKAVDLIGLSIRPPSNTIHRHQSFEDDEGIELQWSEVVLSSNDKLKATFADAIREAQNDFHTDIADNLWKQVFGDDVSKTTRFPFAHMRALVINPRMFPLDPEWRLFWNRSSRYNSRLDYKFTDSFNILPPERSRTMNAYAKSGEAKGIEDISPRSYVKTFEAEDGKEILLRRKTSYAEQKILNHDQQSWEAPYDPSLVPNGSRLFLEAISGFQFFQQSRASVQHLLRQHTTMIPDCVASDSHRDPIAALLGNQQAIMLTTAGGKADIAKSRIGIDPPTNNLDFINDNPIHLNVYYIREQRRPICRIVRRQIDIATMRHAALRYLIQLREAGETLGRAEREYDDVLNRRSKQRPMFRNIRSSLSKTQKLLANARSFHIEADTRESLIYRVHRSRSYTQLLERFVDLQEITPIPTWQSYHDFLAKKVLTTLDYISDLGDRADRLEESIQGSADRVLAWIATAAAIVAVLVGLFIPLLN
ncbi:MAG: DUF3422 family protein [Pseudomonadota bacterium]